MTEELRKFRVGVVTVWEVEANDERNARRVAEGAVQHMISELGVCERGTPPVVRWVHGNGLEYAVTLFRGPAEVGVALRNQYMHLDVHQPMEEA
jgi:hypothetical protein